MNRRRTAIGLAIIGCVAAALLTGIDMSPAAQVRLRTGALWLASNQTGELTLVSGGAATVAAKVQVAPAGTSIESGQLSDTGYALNRNDGSITRIDPATRRPLRSTISAPGATHLLAGDRTVYAVNPDRGTVTGFDPARLTPTTSGMPSAVGESLLDGRGHVWTLDRSNGSLIWFDTGTRHSRRSAGTPGRSALAMVDGKPVIADAGRQVIESVNPDSGDVESGMHWAATDSGEIAVTGSAGRVSISAGDRFTSCDLGAQRCADPIGLGGRLGPAVVVGTRAIVPDHQSGQVTIIDLSGMRVVGTKRLFDRPVRFELREHDGFVFYNDPDSAQAGVLDVNGSVTPITKYDSPTKGPDATVIAGEVAKSGQEPGTGTRPGPGPVAGPQTGLPGPGRPGDPAGLSIAVSPQAFGLVGDQLRFSLRGADVPADTAQWTFGDAGRATGAQVTHSWNNPGTFQVRAALGSLVAQTSVVIDRPGAKPEIATLDFSPARPVIGQRVRFTAGLRGGVAEHGIWTISGHGDPITMTTKDIGTLEYAFPASGQYTVTVTTTSAGQSASRSVDLPVRAGRVTAWTGLDTVPEQGLPPEVAGGVVAISSGSAHDLALKADGSVYAWGENGHGETSVPDAARRDVVAIAAGDLHNLALSSNGVVTAWGQGPEGQVPAQAQTQVKAIAAGSGFSVVLKADGTTMSWGRNNRVNSPNANGPETDFDHVIAIAAGVDFYLALKSDGTLVGKGRAPVENQPDSGIVSLSSGGFSTMGTGRDGSVHAWGRYSIPEGQNVRSAVATANNGKAYVAILADGSWACWGPQRCVAPAVRHPLAVSGRYTHLLVID
ncbi:PKD domain-containing protein [Pseudonocardiaceae bacterium YIM PH 21723]|nr:PKD domain-containing protein [Pseudonocardiaceae bacterium YIM PH 21723]